MTLENSRVNPDTIVVRVDADEVVCESGRTVPYPTWIGTVSRSTGRISIWTPAGYVPRGYKTAAMRMLEDVARQIKGAK
jgi:hypothetical protein